MDRHRQGLVARAGVQCAAGGLSSALSVFLHASPRMSGGGGFPWHQHSQGKLYSFSCSREEVSPEPSLRADWIKLLMLKCLLGAQV